MYEMCKFYYCMFKQYIKHEVEFFSIDTNDLLYLSPVGISPANFFNTLLSFFKALWKWCLIIFQSGIHLTLYGLLYVIAYIDVYKSFAYNASEWLEIIDV